MRKAEFILSKNAMLKQYAAIRKVSDSISYSFKTNEVVGMLLEGMTECSFTVHSESELARIRDRSRVWFVAQGWDGDGIARLMAKGIRSFIVDNEEDLGVLTACIAAGGEEIGLMLRMRMKEKTTKAEKHYVYGMHPSAISKMLPALRQNAGIGRLGVHFHRKTQNIGEWGLREEVQAMLGEKALGSIDLIDIGGGMPVEYKNYDVGNIQQILGNIGRLREWLNSEYNVKMIAEPGRFIAAPCISLAAGVMAVRGSTVILNCSAYNASMDTLVSNIKLKIEGEAEAGGGIQYSVKGCTPDSMDIFRYRAYFKSPPKVGDEIVFLNAGAYNFHTDFCDLPRLETVVIE